MPQINCHNFSPLHFTNAIATNFFFLIPSQDFGNLVATNFFFLPFSTTWLPQCLFSLSSLPYNFGNLVARIGFSLGTPPTTST